MPAVSLFSLSSSVIAVGDPAATRTVYLTTVALVLLGLGLGVLAWWLFRRTRPEPELFAPLEQMESRPWRKADSEQRRQLLDDARPSGARPVSRESGADPDTVGERDLDDGDLDESVAGGGVAENDDDTPVGHELEESAHPDDQETTTTEDAVVDATDNAEILTVDAHSADDDRHDRAGSDDPAAATTSDVDTGDGDDDPTVAIDRASS